jgi:hypothetical protein
MAMALSEKTNRRARRLAVERLESRALLAAYHDLVGLSTLRNDPLFAGIDGSGVSVAVIDSGLDRTHPLLSPNYRGGADLVSGGGDPRPILGGTGDGAHGTHVAGIIAATDPNISVAPAAGLIGLQVFTPVPGGRATAEVRDIQEALQWVLTNHRQFNIVAVNMSLGAGFYTSASAVSSTLYTDAIRRLEAAGVTVVAAAGNSYGSVTDPVTGRAVSTQFQNAAAPGILSTLVVGAVWETNEGANFGPWPANTIDVQTAADRVTSFSQRPPVAAGNAIFAPGAAIRSTIPGNRQADFSGTSMASPIVAGAVALLQEAALQFGGRLLAPAEVRDILRQTADTIRDGDNEQDALFRGDLNGNQRIDANELAALTHTNADYPRINVHNAVRRVRDMFSAIGGTSSDPNGTLAGAILGPAIDGSPLAPLAGIIGVDGQGTNVGGSDVDMIRLPVLAGGRLILELVTDTSQPADFDSMLRLFNSQGTEIAFNDNAGAASGFSRIEMSVTAGTYYVGISGAPNRSYSPNVAGSGVAAAQGRYRLNLSLSNSDPNGLFAGAVTTDIGSDREPNRFNGFLGADFGQAVTTSDVDLFAIHVPDNGILFLDVDTPFNGTVVDPVADTYLRLFDTAGVELTASDDQRSFNANLQFTEFADFVYPTLVFEHPTNRSTFQGHTTDSFIAASVSRGQTFYVGISDVCNQSYNPTSLAGRSACGLGGLYDFTVTFVNNDLNGSIDDALAPSVVPLPSGIRPGLIGADGDQQSGELRDVGDRDVDFIEIVSSSAGILEIDVDSYALVGNTDPVDTTILLFDGQGQRLAMFEDGPGAGVDPIMRAEIAAATTYYLALAGAGNDNFDPFLLGSGTPGDVGFYQFRTSLLSLTQRTALADDVASNPGVTSLGLGATTSGFLGHDGNFLRGAADVDLYRFAPNVSGMVEIATATVTEGSADTVLRVFNSTGAELVFNDDALAATTNSRVTLSVTAGQIYYIGVTGHSDSPRGYDPITGSGAVAGSQGPYTLRLSSADLAGDANRDRRVDARDLAILTANFGRRSGANWEQGDFNLDGKVTLADLSLLRRNYGTTAASPSADSIRDSDPSRSLSEKRVLRASRSSKRLGDIKQACATACLRAD